MNIVFSKLYIQDFKGIEEFEINFKDKVTKIFGDNGTGKTTILDAIYWLFFGKNSLGKAKFDLFPLDKDNKIIEHKYPKVKLDLFIDKKPIKLCKTQKKSCEYLINDYPVKAKEYSEEVNKIVSEKLFSALINPVFFGDNYSWQEQKSIILDNFEVEDIIINQKKYSLIKKEIMDYGVDSSLTKYNKELKENDKKITELKSKKEYIASNLQGIKIDLDKKDLSKKLDILREKNNSINQLKSKLVSLEREHNSVINDIAIDKRNFEIKITNKENKINREINNIQDEKNRLLGQYKDLNSKLKSITNKCAYCGSIIDESVINNQKNKIKNEIKEIINKGNELADKIQILKMNLDKIEDNYTERKDLLEEKQKLVKQIAKIRSNIDNNTEDDISKEISSIETKLNGYDNIVKLQNDLEETVKNINKFVTLKEDVEMKIDLIKEYNREYSQLVADELNKLLNNVKINTFNVQKNGDIKETFEITMYGIPYRSLNSAGKIIAGVELIQLISKALNINFPIIIDNKESITKTFDVENQLITMEVAGVGLSV